MGKKKHGKNRHAHAEPRMEVPPQVAGIAMAMAKQVATPAMRQMLAGALSAAADAVAGRAAPPAPVAPAASVPPAAPVPPPAQAYAPHFEASGATLPPETAQAIEAVAREAARAIDTAAAHAGKAIDAAAAAFGRWAEAAAAQRPAAPDGRPAGE